LDPNPDKPERIATKPFDRLRAMSEVEWAPRHKEELFII